MKTDAVSGGNDIDAFTRILHLGLLVFGLLALASGDFADDYKRAEGLGYLIHRWIGIGVTFFVGLRIADGLWGAAPARFIHWVPYSKERLKLVLDDIRGMLKFRLPDRPPHQGVAGLVEISGLVLFFFLGVTGVLLFFTIEPGHKVQGTARLIKELHEAGETLLPLFFIGHGGAVVLHALAGKHLWRKMIFLKEPQAGRAE